MEFSSDEPSANPAAQSRSTSRMKPKVRARATSLRKPAGVRSKLIACSPITCES